MYSNIIFDKNEEGVCLAGNGVQAILSWRALGHRPLLLPELLLKLGKLLERNLLLLVQHLLDALDFLDLLLCTMCQ